MIKSTKEYFFLFIKGIAMGIADVIPGVSGGTIAFITGIYPELINSISNINVSLFKVWKKEGFKVFWKTANAPFFITLISGILFSVFTFMKLAHYLLEFYPDKLWSFFFGLILASALFIIKQIKKWNIKNVIGLLSATYITYIITSLPISTESPSLLYLLISGAIASCAMILPGISGSFILLLMGSYKSVSEAISNFDITKIIVIGTGVILGLTIFSRILKWLFNNYKDLIFAILTGLILGSLPKIWPWQKIAATINIGSKEIINKKPYIPSLNLYNFDFLSCISLLLLGFILLLCLESFSNPKNKA